MKQSEKVLHAGLLRMKITSEYVEVYERVPTHVTLEYFAGQHSYGRYFGAGALERWASEVPDWVDSADTAEDETLAKNLAELVRQARG